MSKMRQMPLAQFPTFGAVISAIITSTSSICQGPEFIHLVLDSYVELSLKEGERMRRTESTTGIDIIGMNRDTPIPQQLDKFWASEENKRNRQLLVRDIVENFSFVNTTDTFALLLHYVPYLQALGLKEIWQQYDTGEKRRMLPLHQVVAQLGTPLAKTVINVHIY